MPEIGPGAIVWAFRSNVVSRSNASDQIESGMFSVDKGITPENAATSAPPGKTFVAAEPGS